MAYNNLIRAIAEWGAAQPDLLAGVVIGSRSRIDAPADDYSDLDVMLFTPDVSRYADDARWFEQFGTVVVKSLGSIGYGNREWIVVYGDGAKVDFALSRAAEGAATLQALIDACPHQGVLARGVLPLFDNVSPGTAIHAPSAPPVPPLTPAALEHLLTEAWLDGLKAVKSLRRGGLWQAKMRVDGDLKGRLLTLLEWDAVGIDTWHDGRFLEGWADREALAALPGTFAAYTTDDVRRALFATLDLIGVLGRRVAGRLGSAYPADAERQMRRWIEVI